MAPYASVQDVDHMSLIVWIHYSFAGVWLKPLRVMLCPLTTHFPPWRLLVTLQEGRRGARTFGPERRTAGASLRIVACCLAACNGKIRERRRRQHQAAAEVYSNSHNVMSSFVALLSMRGNRNHTYKVHLCKDNHFVGPLGLSLTLAYHLAKVSHQYLQRCGRR